MSAAHILGATNGVFRLYYCWSRIGGLPCDKGEIRLYTPHSSTLAGAAEIARL